MGRLLLRRQVMVVACPETSQQWGVFLGSFGGGSFGNKRQMGGGNQRGVAVHPGTALVVRNFLGQLWRQWQQSTPGCQCQGIPPAGSSHDSTRGERRTFSSLPASMAELTARWAGLFRFAYLFRTQVKLAPQEGLSRKPPPALHFAAIAVTTTPFCQLPTKD
ncbi:hypothetical protein E2320_022479 [Naja naja]|nr:hypothetical protein E2320_022479 [Naja naja]